MRVDSHQHFWQYNPVQHVWMTDRMSVLRRDFLPSDLAPLLDAAGFQGTVAVQARQILEETDWLLALSDRYDFIRGVVGWVDLRADDVRDQLQRYVGHPRFKGVRHIVEDEPDVDFLVRPAFRRGIAALAEFGLTYDLLLRPQHIPAALKLVHEFPRQPFVVDHIAKPLIKDRVISPWREGIESLAQCPNVCCKLSGMVTETGWRAWTPEEFSPYLDIVWNAFGADRLMIGSDWPVCTLSGDYQPVVDIVADDLRRRDPRAEENVLGGNCVRFYRL